MDKLDDYIDIHAHILPGVDDGSSNMEVTIRMLKIAFSQGIRTIIATPHYIAGGRNTSVEQLELIRHQVQAAAEKLDKELTILLGNELYYSESILNALRSKEALTLAGSRYILIEFSVGDTYERMFRGLGELIRAGYSPIIAHVERYRCLFKREDLINELIKLGCYIQMNSNSLIGSIFNQEANFNKKLLNLGMIHFIASDCHDDIVRIPKLEIVAKSLRKKCDDSLMNQVLIKNPQKVLANTYI